MKMMLWSVYYRLFWIVKILVAQCHFQAGPGVDLPLYNGSIKYYSFGGSVTKTFRWLTSHPGLQAT